MSKVPHYCCQAFIILAFVIDSCSKLANIISINQRRQSGFKSGGRGSGLKKFRFYRQISEKFRLFTRFKKIAIFSRNLKKIAIFQAKIAHLQPLNPLPKIWEGVTTPNPQD